MPKYKSIKDIKEYENYVIKLKENNRKNYKYGCINYGFNYQKVAIAEKRFEDFIIELKKVVNWYFHDLKETVPLDLFVFKIQEGNPRLVTIDIVNTSGYPYLYITLNNKRRRVNMSSNNNLFQFQIRKKIRLLGQLCTYEKRLREEKKKRLIKHIRAKGYPISVHKLRTKQGILKDAIKYEGKHLISRSIIS